MKSEYYLATVINAYRRAIDAYYEKGSDYKCDSSFQTELLKTAHRDFTTAYFLGQNDRTVNYLDSQSKGTHKFIATVIDAKDGYIEVEMRNRFKVGDNLEVLSPTENLNKIITVTEMFDENGVPVTDAKLVQQKIKIKTNLKLSKGDMLRAKID
jgi:putative protease